MVSKAPHWDTMNKSIAMLNLNAGEAQELEKLITEFRETFTARSDGYWLMVKFTTLSTLTTPAQSDTLSCSLNQTDGWRRS